MTDAAPAGAPAAAPAAIRVCRDCGATLTGRWCAACGQEDRPLDLTLREVFGEAWEAVTNLEGRAFRSLGRLFVAPGFLTCEYIQGRRTRWISPIRLYVIVSIVYFGLMSLTGWGALDFEIDISGDAAAEVQRALEERGFSTPADIEAAAQDMVGAWLPRAMFVLLPVWACAVAITRPSARMTYPQHLVFALHIHAAAFGAMALATAVTGPFGSQSATEIVQGVVVVYVAVYLVLAQRRVYGGSLLSNVVCTLLISVIHGVLSLGVIVAILLPIVMVRS